MIGFPVGDRAHFFNFLELDIKIGQVIKSTVVTNLGYVHVLVFDKQFAGMTNSYLIEESNERLAGSFFKIPAKRGRTHVCNLGNLIQRYFILKIF